MLLKVVTVFGTKLTVGLKSMADVFYYHLEHALRPTAMPESSEYTKILCLRTRPTYAFLAVFPTGDRIQ
jgi:hypothetical protein